MRNQSEIFLQKRDDTFDIIKGICILLMIVGHCSINAILANVIYSFHMPVFFFIAGFFFKQYGLRKIVNAGIRRLLIPYFLTFLFCFGVAHLLETNEGFSDIIMSRVDYNNPVYSIFLMGKGLPVWFLVSLFLCRIIFIPISKIKNDALIFIVVLLLALLAVNLYYCIKLPLVFLPTFASLGFFTIGNLLATRNIFSNEKMWKYIPLLLVIWLICLSTGKQLNIVFCKYCGFYILDLLGALGVFISIYFVVKKCNTKAISWNFLKWCGINSLIILCVHSVELNFVNYAGIRKILIPIFWPYEIYVVIALRLVFDLVVTYALSKSKFIKRYIFAQYD